jgi:lipopolysaccharide transport system ATP-binding protein
MSNIISVENVSKKYIIRHQKQGYLTLRDAMVESVKNFGKRIIKPGDKVYDDSFEEFWALKDVSFELKQGDRVGIIGRNGAGKSTLLKILSRITEPTSGGIKLRGRVASLLEVGTGFHPELTGRENIFLNGAILGMSRMEIKKKFDEIVAFAEVDKFLDTPVKRYSSGMYVRLAFSVAAHLEPEILIVDEVLAVGDTQFQKKCLGKMESVGKEGRTVLFVSHNLNAVRTLCNRAVLFDKGVIIGDGSVHQVINHYVGNLKESIFSRQWTDTSTPPGNSSAYLRSVRICDDNGVALDEVDTDTAFNIEIDYQIKTEGSYIGITILLYDSENNLVFSSINNHEKEWYGKPMAEGSYSTVCKVPGKLLNNGRFTISLIMFGKGFSDAQTITDVLNIEVMDGPIVRGDFYGEVGGFVRPMLNWNTSRIS